MPRRQRSGEFPRQLPQRRHHDAEERIALAVLAGATFEKAKMVIGDERIAQGAETALDPLPGHYLTIQTSFESSLSFASLTRASASEENFTRTLNVAPDRSTNVDMKPWSIAFAASASAVF